MGCAGDLGRQQAQPRYSRVAAEAPGGTGVSKRSKITRALEELEALLRQLRITGLC